MWRTSPLQAVFTQPTPVLSLGSDLWSPSLSSQPPPAPVGEQTSPSGWWVLVSTDPLCGNFSALPSALCCCILLRDSKASPPSTPCLHQWRGFLVCGHVSSFTAPSQRCRSHPYSFFFCPTQVPREFLDFWDVWGLLPAFSRCSVGVVPHVDVFLMYLWGGRWSPRLTPPPSWRSLLSLFFNYCNISNFCKNYLWKSIVSYIFPTALNLERKHILYYLFL